MLAAFNMDNVCSGRWMIGDSDFGCCTANGDDEAQSRLIHITQVPEGLTATRIRPASSTPRVPLQAQEPPQCTENLMGVTSAQQMQDAAAAAYRRQADKKVDGIACFHAHKRASASPEAGRRGAPAAPHDGTQQRTSVSPHPVSRLARFDAHKRALAPRPSSDVRTSASPEAGRRGAPAAPHAETRHTSALPHRPSSSHSHGSARHHETRGGHTANDSWHGERTHEYTRPHVERHNAGETHQSLLSATSEYVQNSR